MHAVAQLGPAAINQFVERRRPAGQGTWQLCAAASQSAAAQRSVRRRNVSTQRFAAARAQPRNAVVSQFMAPPPPRSAVPALQAVQRRRETPNAKAVAFLMQFLLKSVVPSVLPNPSLHLTAYSGLRPPPAAGELQR